MRIHRQFYNRDVTHAHAGEITQKNHLFNKLLFFELSLTLINNLNPQ